MTEVCKSVIFVCVLDNTGVCMDGMSVFGFKCMCVCVRERMCLCACVFMCVCVLCVCAFCMYAYLSWCVADLLSLKQLLLLLSVGVHQLLWYELHQL